MRSLVILLIVSTVSLAGCTGGSFSNGPDGQTASSDGRLAYNGASTGSHTSDPIECDGSVSIDWWANLGGGKVKITVKDGAGVVQYTDSYSGPGQHSDKESFSGTSGGWAVTAVRTGGTYGSYSGQYVATLSC